MSGDARGSDGSHLLRKHVDVVTVAALMGHAKPSVTLDVYAHEIREAQGGDDLRTKIAEAFGGVL